MYAVIFKAVINELTQEYSDAAKRMRELAGEYGCIDFLSVTEGENEVTLSYWDNLEQIKRWKENPEHQRVQELGKEKWYKSYQVQVVEICREYGKDTS